MEGIDANDTSVKERKARDLMEVRSFTYGEVTFASFLPMIYQVRPQPGEIFYDLGCGSG